MYTCDKWEHFCQKNVHEILVSTGWGMTELSPVGTMNDMRKEVLGSCGVVLSLSEAKIVDLSTGEALPAWQRGELCIRGPQVIHFDY